MKTVQKQNTKFRQFKTTNIGLLKFFYIMGIPLYFLFIVSCNKQSTTEPDYLNQQTETRATICDEPNRCPPSASYFETKDFYINGCKITATYKITYCHDKLSISNMTYVFENSSACNNIRQVWNQYYLAGQSEVANEAINEFYNEITLLIEADIISNLAPWSPPPIIEWIETKCHTLCFKENKDEEGNPLSIELSQVPCGNGCCKRHTKLKVINNVLVKVESSITDNDIPCTPIPINCEGTPSTICSPACARIK